jgi:hypothetical protein
LNATVKACPAKQKLKKLGRNKLLKIKNPQKYLCKLVRFIDEPDKPSGFNNRLFNSNLDTKLEISKDKRSWTKGRRYVCVKVNLASANHPIFLKM